MGVNRIKTWKSQDFRTACGSQPRPCSFKMKNVNMKKAKLTFFCRNPLARQFLKIPIQKAIQKHNKLRNYKHKSKLQLTFFK